MRPDERQRSERGVSDGLLVGLIGFLLGLTVLVWSATGLAAILAHGGWPQGVTFTRTPEALRHLITAPQDVPGAWPRTPAGQLPGWGLFWGLFIGQLMILTVLTIFVVGTLARWKAVRAARKASQVQPRHEVPIEVPVPRTEPLVAAAEKAPEEAPPAQTAPTPAMAADDNRVGGREKSSTAPQTPAPRPQPKPSRRPRAPPSSSPPTPPSGRRPRTPEPNWAPSSSTTPPTSATPRPASTGPPPQAARTDPPQPREQPRSSPRSAPRRRSTGQRPKPPRHSSAATSTPPR